MQEAQIHERISLYCRIASIEHVNDTDGGLGFATRFFQPVTEKVSVLARPYVCEEAWETVNAF